MYHSSNYSRTVIKPYTKTYIMKNLIPVSLILIIALALFSCHKDHDAGPALLVGNWTIVSDSTYNSGIGPNGQPTGKMYIGTAADYYHFTANGKLYVHEGTFLIDTADYTIANDTHTNYKMVNLKFSYLYTYGATITGANGAFDITTVTNHSLVLYSRGLTPGGIFYEAITLRK